MSRFAKLKRGANAEAQIQQHDGYVTQPLFQGGMDGVMVTVSSDGAGWCTDRAPQISALVEAHGAVLIRGLNAIDATGFKQLFEASLAPSMQYTYRVTERTEVDEASVYTSTDFPATQDLLLHHELSYRRHIVRYIAFLCEQPSARDGATPLADGARIYNALPADLIEAFEEKGIAYIRNTGSPITPSWQVAYQTNERDVVESVCRESNIEFEWQTNGELRTIDRQAAALDHPCTGQRVWVNHAHMLHRRSLPEDLVASLFADCDPETLPHHATFGDGSPIPDQMIDTISNAYRQASHRFDWRQNDILLLDNLRFAHGRDRYEGDRRLLVVMGGLFDRMQNA